MNILPSNEIQRNKRLKELYLEKQNNNQTKLVKPSTQKPTYSEERLERELEELFNQLKIEK